MRYDFIVVGKKSIKRKLMKGLLLCFFIPLFSCRGSDTPMSTGPDIRFSEVEAYRHAGDRLEATAMASEATMTQDGSSAHLVNGVLRLPGSDIGIAAPGVDVDLQTSGASGSNGVQVTGTGYLLSGESFSLDGEEGTLTLAGSVSAKPLDSKVEDDIGGESQDVRAGVAGSAADEETAADNPQVLKRPDSGKEERAPVTIEADEVVLHRRKNNAVFSGDVVAVRGDYRLTSRKLTVSYGENQQITRLLAEGDVKVVEADREATANKAEFDNIKEILTLTGDAVLITGENIIQGDRIVFLMVTDEVRVERVRARVRVGDTAIFGGPQ